MPCPKLNITDFFRFAETKKIIHNEVTDLCFAEQKINAHFEYSPFGKTTVATGTITNNKGENIVNRFNFRFSSEYFDTESGLVYYNFRYYSPELGRWLSRDPIGERGGVNLYGMVGNNPVNLIDILGLYGKDVHFYFNYYLAQYLCLNEKSGYKINNQEVSKAYMIAWMAQRVDEDETTEPFAGVTARHKFHFPDNSKDKTIENDIEVRNSVDEIARSGDYIKLGIYLHIYADTYAHQGFGDFWGHAFAGHTPDEPFRHKERDKRMAKNVYEVLFELAKSNKVCCDFNKKSFDDFWGKIENTLYYNSTDEATRIEQWKKLIKNDFNMIVNDISINANAIHEPWVKKFRSYSKDVPKWHKQ